MNVLSLFDGIAVGRAALAQAGIPVSTYWASEIAARAVHVARAQHRDIRHIGAVQQVSYRDGVLSFGGDSARVKIDLILAGSPCQGLSKAGSRLGLKDPRSALFWEFLRIRDEVLSHNPDAVFLLENVPAHRDILAGMSEAVGVNGVRIDSAQFSAQTRKRVYWSNRDIKPRVPETVETLGDIVPGAVGVYSRPRGFNRGGALLGEKSPTVSASAWERNTFPLMADGTHGQFTIGHMERLQGLPAGYTAGPTVTHRRAAVGNAWNLPTVSAILKSIL